MTTYVITAPDGKEYEIDAPQGATQEDALTYFKQNWKPVADKPSVSPAPTPAKEPSFLEQLEKGNIASRIKAGTILYPEEETAIRQTLQGAASGPLMGVVQAGAEFFGNKELADKIAKNKREGNIVGSLMQPEAWMMGGGLSKLVGLGKQALGMGAAGAAYGASSATSKTGEEGLQERTDAGAISGGVGAAIPVVGRAAIKVTPMMKDLVNSISSIWSKGGRTFIGQKMVLDQMPVAEREEVLRILQTKGIDTSELGSQLTTSQALGKARVGQQVQSPSGARVAALESEIAKMPGGEKLNQISAQQTGLQREMMDTLSGGRGGAGAPLSGMSADDLALQATQNQRQTTANVLYPKGEVTGDARLNEILARPGVKAAMGIDEASAGNVPRVTQIGKDIPARTEYKNVFTEWQQTPYKEDLPEVFAKYPIKSLQNQYRLIDKQITSLMKTGVPIDESRAIELMAAKKDLGNWLSSASPEWAQANRIFAYQSVPVTKMEVGAELKRKMAQSPNQFLTATENLPAQEQMIRGVTGRPGKGLSDIFNLGEMSKISGIRNEAQIADEVSKLEKLARANLGDEAAFQLPNLLNVWVAVANRVARTSAKATVDDVTKAAADILSDPNAMRKLLISDAMARNAAKSPVSQQTLGKISPTGLVSGGMLTGD